MAKPFTLYSAGKYRVVDIPSIGSYDLVSGQGYSSGNYAKSPAAFACMDIRATALAEIPWRLTLKGSGGAEAEKPIEQHIVLDLLMHGWANGMSLAEAIRATEIDLCTNGAAFWLKDADRIARLNPITIEVVVSTAGVQGFKQRLLVNGQTITRTFQRDEVVYFREFHPTDDLGKGTAKLEVAKNAILAEYEAQRYIKAFFENDATPGLLMHTEQQIVKTELDKLKQWWATTFTGAKNKHKVGWVDQGMDATVLTSDLRAMALTEVRDEARRDICAIFGVDPILIGSMGKGSFSNTHEARLAMMQEVILPRGDYFSDVINKELVDAIDEGVELEMATDEIPILQEDKDLLAARLKLMLEANVITVEFFRKEMGIPEDAGPSTDEIKAEAEKQLQAEAQAKQPEDMAKWQRKAMKALRAGHSANVPFDTDFIPATLQGAIRARLGQARTPGDVEIAFRA